MRVHYSIVRQPAEDGLYHQDNLLSKDWIEFEDTKFVNEFEMPTLDSMLSAAIDLVQDVAWESWRIYPPRADSMDIWVEDQFLDTRTIVKFELEYGMV